MKRIVVAMLVFIILVGCSSSNRQDDYNQSFQTGIYNVSPIKEIKNIKQVFQADPDQKMVLSKPLIVNDMAYMYNVDKFFAVNVESGKEIWSVSMELEEGMEYDLSPHIAGDLICYMDNKGLYCLDRINGKLVWEKTYNTPLLTRKIIGATSSRIYINDVFNLSSLDVKTGNEVWSRDSVGNGVSYFTGDMLFIANNGEVGIDVVNAKTGEQDDFIDLEEQGLPFALSVQDEIVITTNFIGDTIAYDLTKAGVIWTFENDGSSTRPLPLVSIVDDTVILTNARANQLTSVDLRTGKLNWSVQVEKPSGGLTYLPAITEGLIYLTVYHLDNILTAYSKLICLDFITGDQLWEQTMEPHIDQSPVLSDQKIYVKTVENSLLTLTGE